MEVDDDDLMFNIKVICRRGSQKCDSEAFAIGSFSPTLCLGFLHFCSKAYVLCAF